MWWCTLRNVSWIIQRLIARPAEAGLYRRDPVTATLVRELIGHLKLFSRWEALR